MEEYALLALASYEFSQAGRERVEQELRNHGKEFRVDTALVTTTPWFGATGWVCRGVVSWDAGLGDLVPDAQIALGMSGGRVHDARQRFQEARDKYATWLPRDTP